MPKQNLYAKVEKLSINKFNVITDYRLEYAATKVDCKIEPENVNIEKYFFPYVGLIVTIKESDVKYTGTINISVNGIIKEYDFKIGI